MFQINSMFQVPCFYHVPFESLCFYFRPCFRNMVMFQVVGYISISRPCFLIKCVSIHVLVHCFLLIVFFSKVYVFVSLCFIISIHSKDIHSKIPSSFHRLLCFISSTFNMCQIFIGFISSMFDILGLFLKFFILFLANWLGGTWGEAPSSESVKSVTTWVDLPKPMLHASLSP